MSKIVGDLRVNGKSLENQELLDYIISLQLSKIEKYDPKFKNTIDNSTENAMANLIELLKLRMNLNIK